MRWRVLLQEPLHDPPLAEAMMIFNLVEESDEEEEEEEEEEEWGPQQSALLLYLIDHKKRKRKWKILCENYFARFGMNGNSLRMKYLLIKEKEDAYAEDRRSSKGKEFKRIHNHLTVLKQQEGESSEEEEKKEVSRPEKRKRKK